MKPKRLIETIEDLFNQMIMDDVDFADEILREAGYDPATVGKWGARIAAEASRQAAEKSIDSESDQKGETDGTQT